MVSKFKVGDRVTWTDAYSVKRWGEIRGLSALDVTVQEEGGAIQWSVPAWQVETDIRAHVGGMPAAHPTADTGAKREKLGTIPYDLVPFQEMTDAYVRVAEFGAKKYESWNWSKGLPRVQILCSLLRHTFAYLRGEERDSDSKLLHTDHILWNAVTLVHNVHWGLTDGRRVEPHREYKTPLDTGSESV